MQRNQQSFAGVQFALIVMVCWAHLASTYAANPDNPVEAGAFFYKLPEIQLSKDAQTPVDFKNHCFILKTKISDDTIKDIGLFLAHNVENFKLPDKKGLNFGFERTLLYVGFKIINNNEAGIRMILKLPNPILDEITLYQMDKKGIYEIARGGDRLKISEWTHKQNYFKATVDIGAGDTLVYVLKIKNYGEQFYVPISLMAEEDSRNHDGLAQYYYGLYFGILLFVILFNLFIGLIIKVKSTLLYVIYILGLVLLQLSLSGLAFEFIWPDNVWMAEHSTSFFASFSIFFLILFSFEFLNISSNFKGVSKYLKAIALLVALNMGLSLVNSHSALYLSIITINTLAFILNVLIIPTAIVIWLRGFRPARYFLLSFVFLIFCVFVFILRNFGFISTNWFTLHCLEIGSLGESILISFAIVDKFKTFKDDAFNNLLELNRVKSEANIKLEKRVEERTLELQKQKELVEVKNKNITDSIYYAKKIQEALLPNDIDIKNKFNDSFILYMPKDIVSGDFYWIGNIKDKIVLVAADCTGHGVPGAFMSMLGVSFLNEIVNKRGIDKANLILNELRNNVISTLGQQEDSGKSKDGMDIAVCLIDLEKSQLQFAGAYNPLFLFRNGELIETKADKMPIGIYIKNSSFTNHEINIEKGDTFYIFSDGYVDQFGGDNNTKFMTKPFKKLLAEIQDKPMAIQKELLESIHVEWRSKSPKMDGHIQEQIDDILILGFRF